jgi:tagaturonate reductase
MMTGRVIQFGTSRFLQAHVDLFLHEARQVGQQVPPICVVQSSGSSQRAGRIAAFGQPGGYPVIIRGIKDGAPVEQTITVTSIGQGLDARRDWAELVRIFKTEAAFVVSNTGDTGYEIDTAEQGPALLQRADAPPSFPGKLTALLWQRWQAGATPITILPCELLQHNGTILRDIVIGMAVGAEAPAVFLDWLGTGVIWAETLVDRIVSAPIDPIGAVAEPYALWAIQRQAGLVLPCTHPAIILADDLEPFERLKLHILNLGHTVLADLWQTSHGPADQTVRAMLAIPAIRTQLDAIYRDEVVPGFARHGMADAATSYVATTIERFSNPFLDHRVADIAQNHAVKVARRITAFQDWMRSGTEATIPPTPALDAVVHRAAGSGQAA